ncbi:MAG: 50S ribosomal protein L35ae [Candidatus Diapherotrites archaeon]
MKAMIINYRRGVNTQNTYQMVLEPQGVKDRKEASALIGKTCIYKTISGKEMRGKVSGLHGTKIAVKARFEKPLPGESIGKTLEINE